ncbi:hypothetical protein HTG_14720 [Natrinema mahii]|nr:hypothetical protein HTG_14720 [Natrinema mahii]
MAAPLESKTAIVTGASSGIGAATCHELADGGANVVLAARSEDRLSDLAADLEADYGVDALAVPTDVREADAVDALIETAVDEFGGIDVLVNNVGLARGSDIESMTTDEYETMQETNVDGVFYASRAALPHLRERAGHLVFVASFAGRHPRPSNPVYAATKWWVRGFAKSLAAQVGDDDLGITIVNPAEVRSEFGAADGESFAERFEEGEVSEPEEVAQAIRFAASREGSSISELDINRRDKFADTFH